MTNNNADTAAHTLQTISAAIAARELNRAATLADSALRSGINHPLPHTAKALWLSECGKNADALDSFRRAQTISQPNPSLESAIGLCLMKLHRPEEAVEAFARAIALTPNSASLHCRKGWAHETADDLDMARQEYETALRIQPDLAEALGRLAFLAARRGASTDAETLAKSALAVDNGQRMAHLAIATVDVERDASGAEKRLEWLLSDSTASVTRYLALGLLGDLRAKQDKAAEAFELYGEANREFGELHGADISPNALTTLETVRALRSYMLGHAATGKSQGESNLQVDNNHVFLLGFLRSGTTLLERALGNNPAVVALGEKDTLSQSTQVFMSRLDGLAALWKASAAELEIYRSHYWERVRGFGIDPAQKTFVDKMPINTIKIPLIARIFPDAKVLFALRDPRDVVLSCFRHRFAFNPTTREFLTLQGTAQFYDAVMQLADVYRKQLQYRELVIRHEDLVRDFDRQTLAICEFIGIPWHPAMRNVAPTVADRAIATPSGAQLARGLNADGIGRWRRFATQLKPVLPILMPWVEKFGYPAD